jgi:amino acid transporter
MDATLTAPDARLIRAIGLRSATLLVITNVIGSAIFLTPGSMAATLPSEALLLLAWIAGGVIALCGGLTYAEMGAMYPRSGGLYVFLEEAYGSLVAFLFRLGVHAGHPHRKCRHGGGGLREVLQLLCAGAVDDP